jgi:nitroimidazol reductase NimA-like FMN-containing flavoprotein (pyridoxamine 5'-phosphate oxidase superfamily)
VANGPKKVDQAGLEVLSDDECRRLLAAGGVGRVAIPAEPPIVRPVNFTFDEDRIVIRTGEGALWAAACRSVRVTFEVDGVRNVDHRGWSVLASGPVVPLAVDDSVLALPLRAWAPEGRDRFVAVIVEDVSGRRLAGWT